MQNGTIAKCIAAWAFDIVVALGALACILVWLEVKPKDVRMTGWPHWIWLIGAVILLSVNTWRSFRPSSRKRQQLKLAGVLESKAGQAEWLRRELEKV